jgi:CRISPR-associated protein Cas2
MNPEKDSIRIYYLSEKQHQKIECLGLKKGTPVNEPLIF